MLPIPLAHSGTDFPKHPPCGFVVDADVESKLGSGNTALILCDKVERKKPFPKAHAAAMQEGSRSDRGLMVTLTTLVKAVGEHAMLLTATRWADEPFRPANMSQIVLTGRFGAISFRKLGDGNTLGLLLCHDLRLFLRGLSYYTTNRIRKSRI